MEVQLSLLKGHKFVKEINETIKAANNKYSATPVSREKNKKHNNNFFLNY